MMHVFQVPGFKIRMRMSAAAAAYADLQHIRALRVLQPAIKNPA